MKFELASRIFFESTRVSLEPRAIEKEVVVAFFFCFLVFFSFHPPFRYWKKGKKFSLYNTYKGVTILSFVQMYLDGVKSKGGTERITSERRILSHTGNVFNFR